MRISGKGLLAITVWGVSFVVTRAVLAEVTPAGLVGVRLVLGAGLLLVVLRIRPGPVLPEKADRGRCVFLGFVVAGHLLIQAIGLEYTSAVNTGWIIGFIPVTIAVGAFFLKQQRLRAIGWAGVGIGAAGVLLVTVREPPNFEHARWGDLLQLTSCLTWTVYTLAGVKPVVRSGPLRVTAFAMLVAAVIVVPMALAAGAVRATVGVPTIAGLLFLGLVGSGVAYYCWYAAQREHGPAHVGALLYAEPFVVLAVAVAAAGEPVTWNAVLGGLCVLAGVWLVTRPGVAAQRGLTGG